MAVSAASLVGPLVRLALLRLVAGASLVACPHIGDAG